MMKAKRALALVLAAMLLAVSLLPLTACHGGRRSILRFDIPSDFDPTAPYEITFWAKTEGYDTQTDAYANAVSNFNEYYPNIKVNVKYYSNYTDIYKDVLTNLQTGTTPNVCITYPDHVATYMTGQNVVVPLDSLIEHGKYGLGGSDIKFDSVPRDAVVDKFMNEGKINGVQYVLPYVRSTEACYVNKTFVEALGYSLPEDGIMTWDFVWEVSRAAMEKNGDGTFKLNGQKTLIPFIYKSTDNMMIQMLEQLDAGYTNENGDILLFNDTTKQILLTVGEHASLRTFSTFDYSSYPGNYFNAGQCIFAVDSTAGATWIGSGSPHLDIDAGSVVDFETEVMMIPQYNPESPEMISQGPSICLFNKDDAGEVMASWLFAQFLLTDGVQLEYATTEGYIPVTESAIGSQEYESYLAHEGDSTDRYYSVKLDATRLLIDNIDNTFITPVFNGSTRVRQAAGNLIDEANKAARRRTEVTPSYVDNLYKQMTTLHKLDELQADGTEEMEQKLGEMPAGSVALLVSLGACWLAIGAFVGYRLLKNKRGTDR